ncbi:MAG: hypothetical protein QRY72_03450 [Candidatus Rhabdochlamydia sp.]
MECQIIAKMKPEQNLFITPALKEALTVLAMPIPLLAKWIEQQLEQNPALNREENCVDHVNLIADSLYCSSKGDVRVSLVDTLAAPQRSLHEELLAQGRERKLSTSDYLQLEGLIGHLDERGFLDASFQNHPLTPLLHTFHPAGIGAQNLRHCLLLQLQRKGQEGSLAWRVIAECYEPLTRGLFEEIASKLACSLKQLQQVIAHELAPLSLNPGREFEVQIIPPQMPDAFASYHEGKWYVELNDDVLPRFQISHEAVFEGTAFKKSALWVQEMISRRGVILRQIIGWVLDKQALFVQGKENGLIPLTLQQAASDLSIHLSTVSRAIKDKYLLLPKGIFLIRDFFSRQSVSEEVSHDELQFKIKQIIRQESPFSPLCDQKMAKMLKLQGTLCSRRTVAKYRQKLKIPCAARRKKGGRLNQKS